MTFDQAKLEARNAAAAAIRNPGDPHHQRAAIAAAWAAADLDPDRRYLIPSEAVWMRPR